MHFCALIATFGMPVTEIIEVFTDGPSNDHQILWKQMPTWRELSHDNIQPFHGVNTMLFHLALIYDWAPHGNINQYIASHPGMSRPSLVWKISIAVAMTINH